MIPDPTVSARSILRAQYELRRRGSSRLLDELEEQEPDLAEHLMESLSAIHHDLLALGGPVKKTRRLQRQIQELVLVSITACRQHDDGPSDHPAPEPGAYPPPAAD